MAGSTTKPKVSIIAAVGKNTRAIGRNNALIWKIEGDLPRFKKLTLGHPVIMGRRTFDSIGRPLPGRKNIVLAEDDFNFPDATRTSSIEEAIEVAARQDTDEIFVIGGAMIYAAALPYADKLYLTIVESNEPGDAFFPDWSEFKTVIFEEKHPEHAPPFSFVELVK